MQNYTNSNNDCNTLTSRDVALLRLYKPVSVALFFQIGISFRRYLIPIAYCLLTIAY
jgi:hypothetical protein